MRLSADVYTRKIYRGGKEMEHGFSVFLYFIDGELMNHAEAMRRRGDYYVLQRDADAVITVNCIATYNTQEKHKYSVDALHVEKGVEIEWRELPSFKYENATGLVFTIDNRGEKSEWRLMCICEDKTLTPERHSEEEWLKMKEEWLKKKEEEERRKREEPVIKIEVRKDEVIIGGETYYLKEIIKETAKEIGVYCRFSKLLEVWVVETESPLNGVKFFESFKSKLPEKAQLIVRRY